MAKCSTCKAVPPLPKNLASLRFSGALFFRAVERVSENTNRPCHFDREGLKARRVEKSCAVRVDNIYNKQKRGGGSSFLRAGPAPQRRRRGRRKGRRKEKRKAAYFFRAEGAGAEKRRKTGAKRGCFPREILPRILTNLLSCGILFLPKHSGGVENVRKDHRLHRPFF